MDDLEEDNDISTNQLVKQLLTTEDIEAKTEIANPIAMTTIDILKKHADKILQQRCDADDVKGIFDDFAMWYRINMVSYKRQSRKEVIDAVTAVRTDESSDFARSLLDHALGTNK